MVAKDRADQQWRSDPGAPAASSELLATALLPVFLGFAVFVDLHGQDLVCPPKHAFGFGNV
jgi:hypothetical protein